MDIVAHALTKLLDAYPALAFAVLVAVLVPMTWAAFSRARREGRSFTAWWGLVRIGKRDARRRRLRRPISRRRASPRSPAK